MAWLPSQYQNGGLKTNFFAIVSTSEAETLVSETAECLLAIGKDKKSKLFGVTFSSKGPWENIET